MTHNQLTEFTENFRIHFLFFFFLHSSKVETLSRRQARQVGLMPPLPSFVLVLVLERQKKLKLTRDSFEFIRHRHREFLFIDEIK